MRKVASSRFCDGAVEYWRTSTYAPGCKSALQEVLGLDPGCPCGEALHIVREHVDLHRGLRPHSAPRPG